MRFSCEGEPAPFATRGEALWKDTLRRCINEALGSVTSFTGVILRFRVSALKRNGHPFDLDNLAEPVFAVLINEKGYFGGKRPNIKWWKAERVISSSPGVEIILSDKMPSFAISGEKVFEGHYRGELPKSARDEAFAEWVKSLFKAQPFGERFAVYLTLPERVNLGDISTGPVKHVLDNLYPVFGGKAGSPEDWKIERLFVEKNSLLTEGVKIVITIKEG